MYVMDSHSSPPPASNGIHSRIRQISAEQYAKAFEAMLPNPPPMNAAFSSAEAMRRRQAASRNTSTEDGTPIVQELWRAGGPFLCVTPASTLALHVNDPFRNLERQNLVITEVQRAVDRHGVKVTKISGPHRRRGCGEPEYDHLDRVVLVEAVREENDAWFLAIRDILNLFRSFGWDDVNVEFIDERDDTFFLSPIVAGDRFKLDWPDLKPRVMAFLNDDVMPVPCLTVDCVRKGYGVSADTSPFTVIITLREDAIAWNPWWIKQTLEDIMAEAGGAYITVDVLRGGQWR